jgi:hypothetical protein
MRGRRAHTVSIRRLGAGELRRGRELYPPAEHHRPRLRADCEDMERPCPFVSCKYHLYLDVDPDRGSIKINHPDRGPLELVETCALDVAARGGTELERVGELVNITRERVRQIELVAVEHFSDAGVLEES